MHSPKLTSFIDTRDRLLSEEESTIDTAPKDLGPSQGRVNRGSAKKALEREKKVDEFSRAVTCLNEIEEYSAGSIENAIDLLSLTENKSGPLDKLERHPERRIKSAWASFEEREMPLVKAERPGLRLSQYKQLLQKKWKKSEENPMVILLRIFMYSPPNSPSESNVYQLQRLPRGRAASCRAG